MSDEKIPVIAIKLTPKQREQLRPLMDLAHSKALCLQPGIVVGQFHEGNAVVSFWPHEKSLKMYKAFGKPAGRLISERESLERVTQ